MPGFPKNALMVVRLSVVALLAAVALALPTAWPQTAFADTDRATPLTLVAQQKAKSGWVSTTAGKRYYREGAPLKHLAKIGGWYYYFSARGILQTRDLELDGVTLYIAPNGRVIGAHYKNAYYGKALTRLNSDDAEEFAVLLEAHSLLASICEEGDSQKTMRRKAFDWVVAQRYRAAHKTDADTDQVWIAYQGYKMFEGEGGNCHGFSAAYAYLLAALGESPWYLVDVERRDARHAWVELGGKRYDAVYARWQGYDFYYGVAGRGNFDPDGTWVEYVPVAVYPIPFSSSPDANKDAKVPAAILNLGKAGIESDAGAITFYEDGKRVRNSWRTIGAKRYYFDKIGKAVTGSVRIDGVRYVFSSKGVLARSAKSGLRLVKVAGETYRVDKRGRAVPGWTASGKRYFAKDGKMLKRMWKTIGKARYYFGANGVKAAGPTRIGKAYYLLGKKGTLMRGSSRTGSLVHVGTKTYRVDKSGRAVPGWSADRTQRFAKSGLLLTGTRVLSGRFYAADRSGTYLVERTAQLKAASKEGARATDLRSLLGKPRSELYSASCNFNGDDGVWEYKHFYVFTARPKVAGEFERIVSIAAK